MLKRPVMFLGHDAQAIAVDQLQRRLWWALVDRFSQCQRTGVRQADLAKRLGISRPQIHVWLTDPSKMTLKAAARLMLAMGGEFDLATVDDAATMVSAADGPSASQLTSNFGKGDGRECGPSP